jgi:Polyphosphate kinase C-terminal domain 2
MANTRNISVRQKSVGFQFALFKVANLRRDFQDVAQNAQEFIQHDGLILRQIIRLPDARTGITQAVQRAHDIPGIHMPQRMIGRFRDENGSTIFQAQNIAVQPVERVTFTVHHWQSYGGCREASFFIRAGKGIFGLLVRGLCCLRPGIAGLSENIRVLSIVGRFLEHSRIYYFQNAKDTHQVYLGSADCMRRNLYNRVEVLFPVLEGKLRKRILRMLATSMLDNQGAWELRADGEYHKIPPKDQSIVTSSQDIFMQRSFGLDLMP